MSRQPNDWIYEGDEMPPLSQVIEAPIERADLSQPEEVVGYGFPEDDPTTNATLSIERIGPGQPFIASRYDRSVIFRHVPQRRRRFIAWTDSEGQRWGRSGWESYRPSAEVVGE